MNEYFYKKIISPLGYLYLITDDTHLRAVIYETKRNYFERLISIASPRDNSLINLTEFKFILMSFNKTLIHFNVFK